MLHVAWLYSISYNHIFGLDSRDTKSTNTPEIKLNYKATRIAIRTYINLYITSSCGTSIIGFDTSTTR